MVVPGQVKNPEGMTLFPKGDIVIEMILLRYGSFHELESRWITLLRFCNIFFKILFFRTLLSELSICNVTVMLKIRAYKINGIYLK